MKTEGEGSLIKGDRSRLKQVLINVVKNAIEAMEGEESCFWNPGSVERKVEITIADTGPESRRKIWRGYLKHSTPQSPMEQVSG